MNRQLVKAFLYTLAALVALAVIFLLVGCSSTPDPAPAKVDTSSPMTKEENFDAVMADKLEYGSDPAVVEAAEGVAGAFCDLVDTGVSFPTSVRITIEQGASSDVSAGDIGTIIGAGVPTYCPEYSAELDAFTAAN